MLFLRKRTFVLVFLAITTLTAWNSSFAQSRRLIFTMRDVEEMSTAETAECLGISRINVKVRLHRAGGLVRQHFYRVSEI